MKTARSRIVLSAVIVLWIAARTAPAGYIVTQILEGTTSPLPNAINGSGQIAGRANSQPFLLSGDVLTDLGTFGGNFGSALDLNDSGDVVGFARNSAGHNRAFLYEGSVLMDIGGLGGDSAVAHSINSFGQIVGFSAKVPGSTGFFPFLRDGGVVTELTDELTAGAAGPTGRASFDGNSSLFINDSGVLAGTRRDDLSLTVSRNRGFIYSEDVLTDIGTLGGRNSIVNALNNHGQLVGRSNTVFSTSSTPELGPLHPFLYTAGVMTDLGLLDGAIFGDALGLNDLGQVVGSQRVGVSDRAFLYTGGVLHDLNDLIPADSGWVLRQARAINNQGQIVGLGDFDGAFNRAFLLTLEAPDTSDPAVVPEPSSLALLGTGLVALIAYRRPSARRKSGEAA